MKILYRLGLITSALFIITWFFFWFSLTIPIFLIEWVIFGEPRLSKYTFLLGDSAMDWLFKKLP